MSVLPVGMAAAALPLASPAVTSTTSTAMEPTAATSPLSGSGTAGGSGGFGATLNNALDSLQATQTNADYMATQAATGALTNVADYMVAAEQANIQTQLTAAVKNNALQAFQQIMGMQL